MNLKILNLICFNLFLIYDIVKSNNDEYFDKSIIRALKEKNGQFRSSVEFSLVFFFSRPYNYTRFVMAKEKFNFKINSGYYIEDSKGDFKSFANKYIYFKNKDDKMEMYRTNQYFEICHHRNVDLIFKLWAPENIYDSKINYNILGPNVLLIILLDNYEKNKESVDCKDIDDLSKNRAKLCVLNFEDKTKIEYYLETKNDYTMFPNIVKVLTKNETTNEWFLFRKIKYTDFKPYFDKDDIVDSRLPIGYGCERPEELNKLYPQLETNYGDIFKLGYDINFDYKNWNYRNFSNGRVYRYFTGNHSVRNYNDNKLSIDLKSHLSVEETIEEFSNTSIKNIFNNNTKILNRINLDDNKCITYDLSKDDINYFYIQQIFAKKPKIFYNKNDFTYLGEYKVNDTDCLVFEKIVDKHNWRDYKDGKIQDLSIKNKNQVYASQYTVTHYYPKSSDYWPDNSNQFLVPLKIEIRFYDLSKLGTLVLKVKSFDSNLKEIEDYDTSGCEKAKSGLKITD